MKFKGLPGFSDLCFTSWKTLALPNIEVGGYLICNIQNSPNYNQILQLGDIKIANCQTIRRSIISWGWIIISLKPLEIHQIMQYLKKQQIFNYTSLYYFSFSSFDLKRMPTEKELYVKLMHGPRGVWVQGRIHI